MAKILLYRNCRETTKIERYWNTDTRDLEGTDITGAPTCSQFSLPLGTLVDSWCEGTTKVEIVMDWDGVGRPRRLHIVKTVRTENSSDCAIANPCNLQVVDVLKQQLDSGAFTIRIVTNYGTGAGVEYSLDGINWQTNDLFNGLNAGDYTAYVRKQQ